MKTEKIDIDQLMTDHKITQLVVVFRKRRDEVEKIIANTVGLPGCEDFAAAVNTMWQKEMYRFQVGKR